MDSHLRNEIERLLAEPNDRPDVDGMRLLARARLAAGMAEGLSGEGPDGNIDPGELARLAAFLDGGLSPAERDAMVAALACDPSRRADLASAVELVHAVDAAPQSVPAELMSRAVTEFAPVNLSGTVPAQPQRSGWWHGRRAMWAGAAAVLLVAAAAPSAWRIIDKRFDSPPAQDGEPLPIRSIMPKVAPHIEDQPKSTEQSARPDSPAAVENGAAPVSAAARLQRFCDESVEGSSADQLPNDKAVAERRAVTPALSSRQRDPCRPRTPREAVEPPKSSTSR
jgi:hypothetical protein